MGGGPGVRVHQMGGGMPRRRPHNHANQPPASPMAALQSLLPLLLLFIIPLLSSLFSGAAPTYPSVRFENTSPFTQKHVSTKLKVDYFVNPKDTADYTPRNWRDLSGHVENTYVQKLGTQCEWEKNAETARIPRSARLLEQRSSQVPSRERHGYACLSKAQRLGLPYRLALPLGKMTAAFVLFWLNITRASLSRRM